MFHKVILVTTVIKSHWERKQTEMMDLLYTLNAVHKHVCFHLES